MGMYCYVWMWIEFLVLSKYPYHEETWSRFSRWMNDFLPVQLGAPLASYFFLSSTSIHRLEPGCTFSNRKDLFSNDCNLTLFIAMTLTLMTSQYIQAKSHYHNWGRSISTILFVDFISWETNDLGHWPLKLSCPNSQPRTIPNYLT